MEEGSYFEPNALLSANPALNYQIKMNGNATTRVVFNGTQAKPVTIASALGGGNASFTSPVGDANNFECHWTNFRRLGTASIDCISIDGPTVASFVQIFDHCTWDGCGRFRWLYNPNQTSGYDFTDCTWRNGLGTFLITVGGGTRPVATRRFLRCTFDGQVQIQGNRTRYKRCNFLNGWIMNSGAQLWGEFSECLVVVTNNNGYNQWGNIEGCFFLANPWTGQLPLAAGVATGGGATSLVNAGANYTQNQFQSNQSGTTYVVWVKIGTGAGQFRAIYSNSATQLNVSPSWHQTPDATSQYEIFQVWGNPHYCNGDAGALPDIPVLTGTTTTLTPNASLLAVDAWAESYYCDFIEGTGAGQSVLVASNTTSVIAFAEPVAIPADSTTRISLRTVLKMKDTSYQYAGCSGDGDFWLHLDRRNDFETEGCLGVRNFGWDNSGAIITLFYAASAAAQPRSVRARHNTYYGGQQSLSLIEGWVPGSLAQQLTELKSCYAHSDPSLTYASSNTGPYLCSDVPASGNPGVNPLDLALAPGGADYNGTYGCQPGYNGKGYNTNTSLAGVHDLPFNTNPQFVDPSRDFASWAKMMGAPGTDPRDHVAFGIALIKANPDLTADSLIPWLREGYRPQNEAVRYAGHDGTQIGAVPMAPVYLPARPTTSTPPARSLRDRSAPGAKVSAPQLWWLSASEEWIPVHSPSGRGAIPAGPRYESVLLPGSRIDGAPAAGLDVGLFAPGPLAIGPVADPGRVLGLLRSILAAGAPGAMPDSPGPGPGSPITGLDATLLSRHPSLLPMPGAAFASAPREFVRMIPPSPGEIILALFGGSPLLQSMMPGRIWDRLAGTETPVPFATYAVLSRQRRRLMGGKAPAYETDAVQVTLYGRTDAEVEDLYRAWTDAPPIGIGLDRGIPPAEIPGLAGRGACGIIAWTSPDRPAVGPARLRDFAGPTARDLWIITFEVQIVTKRPRLR